MGCTQPSRPSAATTDRQTVVCVIRNTASVCSRPSLPWSQADGDTPSLSPPCDSSSSESPSSDSISSDASSLDSPASDSPSISCHTHLRHREAVHRAGSGPQLEALLHTLRDAHGLSFPPGRGRAGLAGGAMQHLWTEVQHTHTPLCVYLASELLAFATRLTLAANGFHRHAVPGCCYYASGLAGAAVAEQTKSRPARAAAAAGAIGVSTGLRSRVGGVARRPRASRGSSGVQHS
jgi:hypothetical protein